MFWNKKENKLYIMDAESGELNWTDKWPYYMGASDNFDMQIRAENVRADASLRFLSDGNILQMKNSGLTGSFDFNPLPNNAEVSKDKIHNVVLCGKPFFILWTSRGMGGLSGVNVGSWTAFRPETNEILATAPSLRELDGELSAATSTLDSVAVIPEGASVGFWAKDIFSDFVPKTPQHVSKNGGGFGQVQKIDEDFGELVCPSCWLRFNRDEINYIAVHASLTGDPLMGEDEKLRFLPTEYNAKGLPLDPMGVPAHEMACPHCHRKLPSTFMQMRNHIVSLVGAPSSGKSYFLSILLHELPNALFKNFGVALVDADPPLNAVMTAMKNELFAVDGNDKHFLAKTQLEGGMYDKLVRHGKTVSLPKPFIYVLRDMKDYADQTSVTFYDNAGEHFEPSVSIDDSPGALHVAAADVLMFLYDPLTSNEFKMRLSKDIDPQLGKNMFDQQDIILAEMANRIKQIRNTSSAFDLGIPFAFMVNKCDALGGLFDMSQLEDPLASGKWDNSAVDRNSEKIRNFLAEYIPSVVVNAEMVSKNIKYFMVSSFGRAPGKIVNPDGSEFLAPEISKIRPFHVCDAFIWAFSDIADAPIAKAVSGGDSEKSAFVF